MKKYIFSIVAVFFLSLTTTAQIDRSKQPSPGPAPTINLGTPKKFTLKNGLIVMVVENHKLPRASATLLIDNPPKAYGDKKGITGFVGGMLGAGSATITKEKFDKEVDFLGASISFGSASASASSLAKYFPRVLELMADAALYPVFNQDEFDKLMKQSLTSIKNSEKNVAAIAGRVENVLVYGKKHPKGEFTSETTLKNITLQDVKNYYNSNFKPNNAYLVIIGDVNFATIKKQVTKLFSKWQKGTIVKQEHPKVTNVNHTEINFVNMPNAVQSQISVVNSVQLSLKDKDYFSALLANYILGGGGTARLFNNLREDKGYTYGAYSSIGTSKTYTKFKASAAVRNNVTDSAVVEFMKEINTIRFQPVTEEELKIAKASYTGSFVRALESPATIANYALNIQRLGLNKDFYKNYLKNLNAVTIADVQKAAYKYFKGNKARIIVTGKATEVLKNLEKLNYPIKYFDKNANSTAKPSMNMPIPKGMTADKVVDNYFKAIGGFDKTSTVKSFMSTAKGKVQNIDLTLVTKSASPNKTSVVVSGMGQILSKQVFDGEKGYAEQQGRKIELTADQIKELKDASLFKDTNYKTGKLVRIENIDGKNAYVIVSGKTEVFYDIKTGFKIKEVVTNMVAGKETKTPTTFSDYKAVNGIKFPHKISLAMGPMKLDFTVSEIKINEGVTDEDFK
ncbi:MAG: insulinase family protein [Flavobacteriaceae bacterium]|nr:insulinase family protein [Flavobacteriaceae bacterium]